MDVEKKLYELIMKYAKVSKDYEIKMEDDLVYELGMDSLSLVELIVDLEGQFEIEIEEDKMDVIYKYGKLLNYLQERVGQ